jgi:hypothetical protein
VLEGYKIAYNSLIANKTGLRISFQLHNVCTQKAENVEIYIQHNFYEHKSSKKETDPDKMIQNTHKVFEKKTASHVYTLALVIIFRASYTRVPKFRF